MKRRHLLNGSLLRQAAHTWEPLCEAVEEDAPAEASDEPHGWVHRISREISAFSRVGGWKHTVVAALPGAQPGYDAVPLASLNNSMAGNSGVGPLATALNNSMAANISAGPLAGDLSKLPRLPPSRN